MRTLVFLAAPILISGCGATSVKENVNVEDQLAAIAAKCEIPRDALRYAGGLAHVIADETQSFATIKCAFDELDASGLPTAKAVINDGGKPPQ